MKRLLLLLAAVIFMSTACNTYLVGAGGDYDRLDQVPPTGPGDLIQLVSNIQLQANTVLEDMTDVIIDFDGYKATQVGGGDGLVIRDSVNTRIQNPRIDCATEPGITYGSGIAVSAGAEWTQVKGGEIKDCQMSAVAGSPGRYSGRPGESFGPIAVLDLHGHHINQNGAFPTGPSIISFYHPIAPASARPSWWPSSVFDFVVKDVHLHDIKDTQWQTDGNGVIFDDWKLDQSDDLPQYNGTGCAQNVYAYNLAPSGERIRDYNNPAGAISSGAC